MPRANEQGWQGSEDERADAISAACTACRQQLGDDGPLLNPGVHTHEEFQTSQAFRNFLSVVLVLGLDPKDELKDLTRSTIAATRVYEMDANSASRALPSFERAYSRFEELGGALARSEGRAANDEQRAAIDQAREFATEAAVKLERLCELAKVQERKR